MLARVIRSIVRDGTLILERPGRAAETFGTGFPRVRIRLHDRRAELALLLNPDLAIGELYMDGRLTLEEGDLVQFIGLLMHNAARGDAQFLRRFAGRLRTAARTLAQINSSSRAKAHVAHHYDLSGRLYDLFLDSDRQYSCAYFRDGTQSIDAAQAAKKRHIAAKLALDEPGLKVLDIGCGWGGMALELARENNASVTGITLSEEQLAVARSRAQAAGLSERCRFDLIDYRAVEGPFDRIVSVGMFEHVGVGYYRAFFEAAARLLDENGVMLLHFIGRTDGGGYTNPWIAKYIFPGGYAPALSEVLPVIEKSGLIVTDIEVLRLHYAETLKAWRARFAANRAEVAKLYDERFCRMWEFYLACAECAFRHEKEVVFQIQMTKKIDALPLTRDYMMRDEIEAASRSAQFESRPSRAA